MSQSNPSAVHDARLHPQTLGVPVPPHVSGAVQLPQVTVPPQPSGIVPQFFA
jgi:hypothetical protein